MAVSVRSFLTLFISVFLSGFEYVSLGRLCWLYCGRVLLLECVSPLSLLPLGRLRWMYYGFLGL